MRQTDLKLLYRGGSSSSDQGVRYPVVLRNPGVGTFWDVELRATHNSEETDRAAVRQLGPQSETDQVFLLIPARFCDKGTPGIGLRPLGRATADALIDGEVVASVDLPGGQAPEPNSPEGSEGEIDRVPRTPDEEAALLAARPDGWEHMLFAAVLRRRMDALEPKYRDHQLRFARPGQGPVLGGSDATEFLSDAFNESVVLMSNFDRVFDRSAQERAFGVLGEAGDAAQIEHLATRVIDIYEGLLDWAARVRDTRVEEEFEHAVELASRFVDGPIQQFRDFVARTVAEIDQLPSLVRAEEPVTLTLTLTLEVEEGLTEELGNELRRLEDEFAASPGFE